MKKDLIDYFMEEKMTGIDFVNAIYELFSMFKNYNGLKEGYVGSRIQARLIVQLKLNCYIPLKYVRMAFDSLLASGLIESKFMFITLKPVIGKKTFNQGQYEVFQKNNLSNEEELLKSIAVSFNNIKDYVKELPLESDVNKIFELSKIKNKPVRWFLNRGENEDYCYLLYDLPRERILQIIENIELYDPDKEENKFREKQEQINAIFLKNKNKYLLFLDEVYQIMKLSTAYKNVEIHLAYAQDYSQFFKGENVFFGKIVPESISLDKTNGILTLKNSNFNLNLDFYSIEFNFDLPGIFFSNGFVKILYLLSDNVLPDLKELQYKNTSLLNEYGQFAYNIM